MNDMNEQLWANLEKWRAEGSQAQIVAAIRELAIDERGYELQMELVWALERLNDFDGAIDELLRAEAEGEHDPQWHYLLGGSYFALEQYDLAMKAYEQALLLDGTDERTWRLLDHCCRQMGEISPLYQQLGRVYGGALHPVSYEAEALAAVKRHIRRYFGDAAMTIQEAASEEIGLEIQIIQPTLRRPFYTLVTVGMGAFRMQVPELLKASKLERAELLICLPMDWQVNNPLPQWHWPIGWLKALAALPAQEGGWLAWGHTVPNDGPIAEGTALCGMILSSPCALPKEAAVCALPDGGEVNFYQLIPLYEEELRFKRERGAEALFGRFDDQVDHVVDIYRPNACAVLINKQWAIPAEAIKPLLSGWQGPDGALATDRIVVDGQPVGYMYREAPEEDATDSGWRFLAGDESEEYIADYDHFGIYRLNTLCNYDPDILPYLHAPYGTAYYRDENGVFQQEIKRPPTFHARVQAFWQWFEQQEEALVQLADAGDSEAWQQLMAAGTLLITEELPCCLLDKRAIVWPADMCPWRFYLLPYLLAAAPERVRLHWQLYAGRPALEAGDGARLESVLAALSGEGAAEKMCIRDSHQAGFTKACAPKSGRGVQAGIFRLRRDCDQWQRPLRSNGL